MPEPQKKNHCKDRNQSAKPYNFFGDYLWKKYGSRILKLPINAGFTCPNKDGLVGTEGCIFCAEDGSASPSSLVSENITAQMETARKNFKRSETDTKYIAYFQAFSNTYSEIENLKYVYDTAVGFKDIVGLMIATRSDCLPEDVLDLICGYAKDNFELWLEIGMQTIHEKSLAFLNRRHSYDSVKSAVFRAHQRKIPVCLHVILGIPGESWRDMMDTAKEISSLPVSGVKIHHLHVIKGTRLEEYYKEGKADIPGFKEYVSILCDFLERLRPDILIHRLLGDRSANSLVAPKWGMNKGTVIKAIGDEFARRCTYQGFLL
ncbi:MAG: TIGR01212 family radical SAM protein [Spirochaetota bacterium]